MLLLPAAPAVLTRRLRQIFNSYDVAPFGGKKSVVVAGSSALGGKHELLGGSYIVVGAACILAGVSVAVGKPKKRRD